MSSLLLLNHEEKNKNIELLKSVTEQLVENGTIEHSCNVGIAILNVNMQAAKYISLFSDWHEISYHYLYPLKEFESRIKDFCSRIEQRKGQSNWVFHSHANAYKYPNRTGLSFIQRKEFLRMVSSELKETVFHLPVITQLYSQAQTNKCNWAYCSLFQHPFYLNRDKERTKIETGYNQNGHWNYGLELENLFFCIRNNNYFAVYFVKTIDDVITLICSACKEESHAIEFGRTIDSLPQKLRKKLGFNIHPFAMLSPKLISSQEKIRNELLKRIRRGAPTQIESLHEKYDEMVLQVQLNFDEDQLIVLSKYINSNKEFQQHALIDYVNKIKEGKIK